MYAEYIHWNVCTPHTHTYRHTRTMIQTLPVWNIYMSVLFICICLDNIADSSNFQTNQMKLQTQSNKNHVYSKKAKFFSDNSVEDTFE